MRRYQFLGKSSVFEALNKLRAALLAARNEQEVDEIIKGLFTNDERMKIGRRIQIAELLKAGLSYIEIQSVLYASAPTIAVVDKKVDEHPVCYEIIMKKEKGIKQTIKQQSYQTIGGSTMIFKKKEYVGVNKQNIKR